MDEPTAFDAWGIVELFGHQRIAGKLTEQLIAGTTMLRVDVPTVEIRARLSFHDQQRELGAPAKVETVPGFTKLYGAGAIYGITPTDEATARLAAASLRVEPCERWRLEPLKQLEAKAAAATRLIQPAGQLVHPPRVG
jgi:hypothetical protein